MHVYGPQIMHDKSFVPPMEEGKNTSTVTLRVLEGDEKGSRCLRV
jgi:hypothetical protein